ncbi:hypothetical protein D3C80_1890310 [compost metagenome]
MHDARVEPGTHDEVRTGLDGLIDLGRGQDGAGANDHLGEGAPQLADSLSRRRGAEGDLGTGHAVFHQGAAEGDCIVGIFDGDDGDDLQGAESFKQC